MPSVKINQVRGKPTARILESSHGVLPQFSFPIPDRFLVTRGSIVSIDRQALEPKLSELTTIPLRPAQSRD